MGESIIMAIIWLGFFAAVFLGWYFYLKARNKERMSLIERGTDVSEIYQNRRTKFKFPWLKLGIIFLGFSLGLFTTSIFANVIENILRIPNIDNELFAFGTIFLFTAISIIVAYFVDKPKTQK